MATRLIPFPVRLTDTAGRPISGGKAFFYATGTTDLQDTYVGPADDAAPNANPVVANAAGLFGPIYLDPDLTYDVVYTDAAGDTGSPIQAVIGVGGSGGATKPYSPQAGSSYAVTAGDRGKLIKRTHSAASTTTLPAANATSIGNGYPVTIWNGSSYDNTVTISGGGTIDGVSSRIVRPGQRIEFISTGSEWTAPPAPLTTGYHVVPVSAAFLTPATTNPCGDVAQGETSSYKVNFLYREFDDATTEYGCQAIVIPSSWDGETLAYRTVWTATAGTAGETIAFGLQARVLADFEALDSPWGTASLNGDEFFGGTGFVHVTGWSDITVPNPVGGHLLLFRFYRDAASGTHNHPIRLISLDFRFGLVRGVDS